MLQIRALISIALAAYIVAVPAGGLSGIARVWAWYGAADALAALLSIAILPPRHPRSPSLLVQAVWSIGAALTGFLIPNALLLMLFVLMPLWSVGSIVLGMVDLQQVRAAIEARWLLTVVVLAGATFAAVFLGSPADDTTWLRAALAAGGVASSVVFLLTSLSVNPAAQR